MNRTRPRRTLSPLFTAIITFIALVGACSDDAAPTGSTLPIPPTSTVTTTVSTTSEAVTTTKPEIPSKTPAATVEELVTALYAALNAKDDAALQTLSAGGAYHSFYYYDGSGPGMFPAGFAHEESELETFASNLVSIEVTGELVVSGDAVAIPVRYTHGNEIDTGYDILRLERTTGGLLIVGGATLYAAPTVEMDVVTGEVVWAEHLAWNADDSAAVLAAMDPGATLWEDVTDPDTKHSDDGLADFLSSSMWFDVEFTGDLQVSGPFAAAPTRLFTSASSSEGITIYLVRDGKIVLQAFAQ
jgi:hypothetical protein